MDVFNTKKRSEIMSKIRSKNTGAELLVFRELRKRKIHFQKHYKRALGSPDVAFPRRKIAVFIDGDFWHGRNFSKLKKRLPKKYWRKKIEDNIKRDRTVRQKLRREGWRVLRLWEKDILRDNLVELERMISFIKYK